MTTRFVQDHAETAGLVARLVVAICLLLEAVLLLLVGVFVAGLSMFVGALAFMSNPPATHDKYTQGLMAIGLTMVAPFVMAAAVTTGGILLVVGKGKPWIVAAAIVALLSQLTFRILAKEPFSLTALLPCSLHIVTILAAYKLLPQRPNTGE